METDKLMWLAGLLEREGCFFLSHGNSSTAHQWKDIIPERLRTSVGGEARWTGRVAAGWSGRA